MGGFGSGRGQTGKDTTSDLRPLDVRWLQRDGLLAPGRCISLNWSRNGEEVASIQIRTDTDRVVLNYRYRSHGIEWKSIEYPVYLEWTPCHLGGRRAWFLCPTRGCGRRVAILYGGTLFACRQCHKLAYACQRERAYDRQARRADKIRERLKWEPGILNGNGWKPTGMHWRTFTRLKAEHDAYVQTSLESMAERLSLVRRNLGRAEQLLNGDG